MGVCPRLEFAKIMLFNCLGYGFYILREKSLAMYFGDKQFTRNRTLNLKVSKIYVDKRSRVR